MQALGLSELKVTPDPVLIASEAALWGAIHHQGLLQDTVIVSDDAGQFRVGVHALCWVHAERLVHKLIPANDKQRNAVEVAKRMIWWFYRALKEYKLAPSPEQAQILRARFDRIFKRGQNRLRDARQSAQTPVSPQGRSPARPRTAGNSAQHQRLRKRHPRLRHEKKNLRRNRQRQGPRRPRRHARPGQDLHETRNCRSTTIIGARLGIARTQNPAPRQPHPPSPRLKPKRPPGNLPRLRRQFPNHSSAPVIYESNAGIGIRWSGEKAASVMTAHIIPDPKMHLKIYATQGHRLFVDYRGCFDIYVWPCGTLYITNCPSDRLQYNSYI